MFFRCILNFIIRCQIAVYQGFIEYCQRGCLIGSRYLVKPNYHVCERRLWSVLFIVWSSVGFSLILYYMNNYSKNVYRVVIEQHERNQEFNYPTLGICEIGTEDDKETLLRVEKLLNGSLYRDFPSLRTNNILRDFVYNLTFQNHNRKERNTIEIFYNYTKTLSPNIRAILEIYYYKGLAKKIISNCKEFFMNCHWLQEPFECCHVFQTISTMMGQCFVFNSNQSYNPEAAKRVKQIEIFREPYRLKVKFTKAARIFILNNKDIPETIAPLNRYKLTDKGVTLSLEFHIVPILNDPSLLDLNPQNLRCIQSDKNFSDDVIIRKDNRLYPFESYTTCITENFYVEQWNLCECKNLYYPELNENIHCNLTQYVCLEKNGFINPRSMTSSNNTLIEKCLPICDDSEYVMENAYYSETTSDEKDKNLLTLDFALLNFPTIHKRRQAIRQSEDKLVSFSGILGLFMGLNMTNILEFIFLSCCAFWKYERTTMTQGAIATNHLEHKRLRPQVNNGRVRVRSTLIVLQP